MTVASWKASLLEQLRHVKGYKFTQLDLFLGKNKLDDSRHLVYYNLTTASCVEVVPTGESSESDSDLGDPQARWASHFAKIFDEWRQARRN